MTDQLDALPESVRDAWRRMRYASDLTKGTVLSSTNDIEAIFHDHIHQAARVRELERENGELRSGIPTVSEVQWKCAEKEMVRLRERLLTTQGKLRSAEAERDALKARIAEAPTCNVMLRNCDPPMHAHDVVCYDEKFMDKWMRVALLPLDNEAKS